MKVIPEKNFFAVIDAETGQHLMHVIDAHNLDDPTWNPKGSMHIHVPLDKYVTMKNEDLHAHINEQFSLKKGDKL